MYTKFIPISAVESFDLFPFTGDFLNFEMFKYFICLEFIKKMSIFAWYLVLFSFLRDQCRFPFRIKKLNILPLLIYMVHDYSFFCSTADFVMKKGTFWIFTGFGHLALKQSGQNVIFEKDWSLYVSERFNEKIQTQLLTLPRISWNMEGT